MRLFSALLSFLIPPRPAERIVSLLRLEELRALHPGLPLPYSDPRVKALVWELKYHQSVPALALASTLLAEEFLGFIGEETLEPPVLIPIPMHENRRRERRSNHTEALCAEMLRKLPRGVVRYERDALRKEKETPRQVTLAAAARRKNVEGSFDVPDPSLVRGKLCIVLDDVTTTGATLIEASVVLRRAGAREVVPLVLAQ